MGKGWKQTLGIVLCACYACFLSIPSFASELPPTEWNLEMIARSYPTPELIARFLRNWMTPADDRDLFGRIEYWQSPEEFLTRRQGDCEDYALLTQALLERLGIEAYVFTLYGEKSYAHTVTVFKERGRYHVINQDHLIRLKAKTLEELASMIYPRWTWGAMAAQRGHQGRIIREVFKTSVANLIPTSELIDRSA